MRGSLIVFEGIDGTGKGVQMSLAVKMLQAKFGAENVVQTKEPGGTKLGASIRRVMYEEVPTTEMVPGVVDLLFLASHLQNWLTIVKPALDAGKVVVSDRWWYSQLAYMSERFVPIPVVYAYESCKADGANLFIFLYGDANSMIERARARTEEVHQKAKAWNDAGILSRIQERYFKLFAGLPEFFPVSVDNHSIEDVWLQVAAGIQSAVTSGRISCPAALQKNG